MRYSPTRAAACSPSIQPGHQRAAALHGLHTQYMRHYCTSCAPERSVVTTTYRRLHLISHIFSAPLYSPDRPTHGKPCFALCTPQQRRRAHVAFWAALRRTVYTYMLAFRDDRAAARVAGNKTFNPPSAVAATTIPIAPPPERQLSTIVFRFNYIRICPKACRAQPRRCVIGNPGTIDLHIYTTVYIVTSSDVFLTHV